MREFRLQIRIKNNLLVKRREELGLSLKAAAEKIGVALAVLMNYENLKADPIRKRRGGSEYKDTALKVADFYKCMPADLWPDTVCRIEKNRVEREVSAAQIGHLSGLSTVYASLPPDELCELKEAAGEVADALECVSPRERDILMRRNGMGEYDEQTFRQIGRDYGLSGNRVMHIVNRAYSKIRYKREGKLKETCESIREIRDRTVLASTYESYEDES